MRYTPSLNDPSAEPSRSVEVRVVSPCGPMMKRSICGTGRTVRSVPTTATRIFTGKVVSGGGATATGAGGGAAFALSAAVGFGLSGPQTDERSVISDVLAPARRSLLLASSSKLNETQFSLAKARTRLLGTLFLTRSTMSDSE